MRRLFKSLSDLFQYEDPAFSNISFCSSESHWGGVANLLLLNDKEKQINKQKASNISIGSQNHLRAPNIIKYIIFQISPLTLYYFILICVLYLTPDICSLLWIRFYSSSVCVIGSLRREVCVSDYA